MNWWVSTHVNQYNQTNPEAKRQVADHYVKVKVQLVNEAGYLNRESKFWINLGLKYWLYEVQSEDFYFSSLN